MSLFLFMFVGIVERCVQWAVVIENIAQEKIGWNGVTRITLGTLKID